MMDFNQLIQNIQNISDALFKSASKSVNIHLSLRNLYVGYYIVEFEQNGSDRAKYGEKLLEEISKEINIKDLTASELSRCRQLYSVYQSILGTVSQKFLSDFSPKILGSASQELQTTEKENIEPYLKELFYHASYSHLTELIKIDDDLKRKFYELLIIKPQPSVRELRRQINSLAFERVGLSNNYEIAINSLETKVNPQTSTDIVKSHYFFEFLKFNNPNLVEESELEQALITNLQEFIIELGNGFCFEARQKRILIDDEYFFIDLVFYHRILKCHVLIELKTEKAKHEHIGQLKTYIQFYKHQMMEETDNPPVGILLVTDKNETLVEYAIADDDKEIFVSKYALQLPKKKELEMFIKRELYK